MMSFESEAAAFVTSLALLVTSVAATFWAIVKCQEQVMRVIEGSPDRQRACEVIGQDFLPMVQRPNEVEKVMAFGARGVAGYDRLRRQEAQVLALIALTTGLLLLHSLTL